MDAYPRPGTLPGYKAKTTDDVLLKRLHEVVYETIQELSLQNVLCSKGF